jgi:hypothetical protein
MIQTEVRIPFKLFLGSEKDIEDTTQLYEVFNRESVRKGMDES